jgi:glutamate synthase domain-containing protein 2/glutamate synthase domain-containing protein 1/glutamate synthase domain-containing protein 3
MDKEQIFKQKSLYYPSFDKDGCGVGFVCDVEGKRSNEILHLGIEALKRLEHRGAVGADPRTGDGAGILIQLPHKFFKKVCSKEAIELPPLGEYGTGIVFFPPDKEGRDFCKNVFAKIIKEEGLSLLGYRNVPIDSSGIGQTAKKTLPVIEQIFVRKLVSINSLLEFEVKLYLVRKQVENIVCNSTLKNKSYFYVTNISSRTVSYKGLLMSRQLENFFLDLKDPDIETSICLIHARYSTNTFPTWDLAQPFRFLAHNGEINTLRGNINWMRARQGLLKSEIFGKDIRKIFPILVPGGSDSATIDNAFELLVLGGRSPEEAMLMLIPAAWENNPFLDSNLKAFYEYHACFMEPWDGPAAIAFTDGRVIGAVLDRNGLRPARYIVTKDGLVVMASEVGVLDIAGGNISISGRLEPGKIFLIDTEEKRIIPDEKIKEQVCRKRPYRQWLSKNLVFLENLPDKEVKEDKEDKEEFFKKLKFFGYSREKLKFIIRPMVENAKEPIGSMGNDTPCAVLSKKSPLLYNYFKQLFAQVTNPAIDPIREEVVMSLTSYVGKERNVLEETPYHCHKLKVTHPILKDGELSQIRYIEGYDFKAKTISILFEKDKEGAFLNRLETICKEAEQAIAEGYSFVIISDRGVNEKLCSLPALLATGALHHYLVRKALRTQIGIILETAEPHEVHHFALLFGYGADLINPYLALKVVKYLVEEEIESFSPDKAISNYIEAVEKGILKILSKMGISTLQSYRGAQIFEALGLNEEVVERCFAGTVSRIGGIGFDILADETIRRHNQAYPHQDIGFPMLATGGVYQWKRDGEFHLWNPSTITSLQEAVRREDYDRYKEFAEMINDQSSQPTTLRSLLKFKEQTSIPLDEVEKAEEIVKRFAIGAMSFGSISKETHESIAIAMNRLGGMSNSGEGGEDPARFIPLPSGDSLRSKVKQVASGRFGVTTYYLVNADELQIKIAQGAKPGEGGHLPGHKVSTIIARTRYTTPGVTLISPPPHHDIYSIEDLAQLIFDLKNANPRARISVKLVSEIGVGTIAAGVAKGYADMILISGGDGGTGASPLSSIHYAGLPWELGISETHQTLVLHNLRTRVRLQTDGQMRTGRDVAIAAILGAEEFGFCTSALVVLGCVMLRHCHLNNCSVGVATQDEILRKRFRGRPEHLVNYFHFVAEELREIMAYLGVRKVEELVGRTEFLEVNPAILDEKTRSVDFSRILFKTPVKEGTKVYCCRQQEHKIHKILDRQLIKLCDKAVSEGLPVKLTLPIKNTDRTTGAMLSGEVARLHGEDGLGEDTIYIKFRGVAGQSFAAFLMRGITFELEGLANDYVGKGMFGGKLIVYPDREAGYKPEENIIIGNTTFYGAVRGEAYIRGVAGERFCIRNSGLYAVIEGIGDHGCEYMTGGRVVILGKIGRNFAAGMSGGIAYIYDQEGTFRDKCNMSMVELEEPDSDDKITIKNLVHNHYKYTKSEIAKRILDDFTDAMKKFIKVMPIEYKRILEGKYVEEALGLMEVSDG